MSGGRSGRQPAAALLVVLAGTATVAVVLGGCAGAGGPTAGSGPPGAGSGPARSRAAAALPDTVEQLGRLVVDEVPSGLPRMPDSALQPPAGPKDVAEVAAYADDPGHERTVLGRYGFRYAWERFWGRPAGPVTSVFVDQFDDAAGARVFAADLARNDAAHYHATLHEHPPQLPDGCRLLTVDRTDPRVGLDGPAAFAWCASGVFSVAVTSVTGSVDAAVDEVSAVVEQQLSRLPAR